MLHPDCIILSMVLASVFGGSSPRNCPKLEKFEIRYAILCPGVSHVHADWRQLNRPDDDIILIRGHPTEASDVSISGVVVLMISEPHTVKSIKITLQGKWKVGYV